MNHFDLVASLVKHEAKRFKAYDDATGLELKHGMTLKGNLTIGVGHNLTANGVSDHVTEELLEEDIAVAVNLLDEKLKWWRDLGDGPQNALVELAFNLGEKILTFVTVLFYLRTGEPGKAADDLLLTNWAKQVGPTRANDVAKEMRS